MVLTIHNEWDCSLKVKKFCETNRITLNKFLGKTPITDMLFIHNRAIPKGFNPTIGFSLYLGSVKKLPEGFSPTIGGSLYIGSVEELPKGFNPTVQYDLDIKSVKILPKGFKPTVGGSVLTSLKGKKGVVKAKPLTNNAVFWRTIHGDTFVKTMEFFGKVLDKNEEYYTLKKCYSEDKFYAVTDNKGNWGHGATVRDARIRLQMNKL